MKRITAIIPLILVSLNFTGCEGEASQDVPDADLLGTLWTLQSIEVPGEPGIQPNVGKNFSIQFFEDNQIEGHINCNTYKGEYAQPTIDSMKIIIQEITEVNCADSDKAVESRLLEDISSVHSYGIIKNRLQLHFDSSVLNFQMLE